MSTFTNDAGYLTSVPAQTWASVTGKPTAVSAWTNDSGYLTATSSLAWAKVTGAPAFLTSVTGSGAGLTSGTVPVSALVMGDYSSRITSGSYSINISGTAAA